MHLIQSRYVFLVMYSLEQRVEVAWSRVGSGRFPNLPGKSSKE